MLQDDLQEFGMSEDEAKLYLICLELGGAFASSIAKKAGVARVNAYYLLDKLKEKGYVTQDTRNGVKFFIAEPPQVLVNKMEERYQKAKSLLPDLLSVTSDQAFKPVIRSYEGIEGIKNIFEQSLNSSSEIVGYTNLAALGKLLPDFLPNYTQRLVQNQIKTRWLSPSTEASREFLSQFYPENFPHELVEILFVNPKEFAFENQIAIFDNFVTIVSLNPNELMGISIESPVHAHTQKAIFNLSWLGATSFVAR